MSGHGRPPTAGSCLTTTWTPCGQRNALPAGSVACAATATALVGPAQDPEGAGQLYAINVDPDQWGTGAGRALLAAAQAELVRLGYTEAVLWVLPGNARARRFYEVAGWAHDGAQRTGEAWGIAFTEVRYRRRLQGLPGRT
jgi:ribosomal protein S18 acetylase RimI-like enzyme